MRDRTPPGPLPIDSPFAALAALRDRLPPGRVAPEAPSPAPSSAPAPARPERAVIRYERKGHGGKEVTRLELRGLPAAALDDWLGDLKRSLGCGGRVEDGTIALQGDQRERLGPWLKARGVRV